MKIKKIRADRKPENENLVRINAKKKNSKICKTVIINITLYYKNGK